MVKHLSILACSELLKTLMMRPCFVLFTSVVHIVHWEDPRAGIKEAWVLVIALCLTSKISSSRPFHLSFSHQVYLSLQDLSGLTLQRRRSEVQHAETRQGQQGVEDGFS